jgi:hypothetical protein
VEDFEGLTSEQKLLEIIEQGGVHLKTYKYLSIRRSGSMIEVQAPYTGPQWRPTSKHHCFQYRGAEFVVVQECPR